MQAPGLKDYTPIPDQPTFRVLRAISAVAIVLALVSGGMSEYAEQAGVTKYITGVCIAIGLLLGLVCIFFSRACPRCGRTMIRQSPGRSDFLTSYKYACPECRLYIDTLFGHGGN
jgi:predicted RNA-binding Zn-ribbon protein involved in translation (DUF1610 family)